MIAVTARCQGLHGDSAVFTDEGLLAGNEDHTAMLRFPRAQVSCFVLIIPSFCKIEHV